MKDAKGTEIIPLKRKLRTYPHSWGPGKVHAVRRHLKGSRDTYALCVDVPKERRDKGWGWALRYHCEDVPDDTMVTCIKCEIRLQDLADEKVGK